LRGLPSQLPFLKNYKREIRIDKEVIFGKPGRRGGLRGLPSQLPFLKNYKREIRIDREVIFGKPGRRVV